MAAAPDQDLVLGTARRRTARSRARTTASRRSHAATGAWPVAIAIALAAAAIPASPARAHIGPSVRENNRYIKLTLLGNRVRLLYTFYVGEVPGQHARHRMDADRDGAISPAEARGFGAEIATTVAASLQLSVDGSVAPTTWTSIDVGLGTPTTAGGAFSVDLVAWVCLPSAGAGAEHELLLYDHWRPPQPGETELRVEESPGVTVARSHIGIDGRVSQLRFKWVESRPPLPLDERGLYVRFRVDPEAADVDPANGCGADAAAPVVPARTARWPLAAAIAGLACAAGVLLAARRYRKTNG